MAGNSFYLDAATRVAGRFAYGQIDYRKTALYRNAASGVDSKEDGISDFGKLVEIKQVRPPLTAGMKEAYIQELYGKIASIPVHPSRRYDSILVEISDEGLEAMWKDPEYEKWVLDTLRKDLATANPWYGVSGGYFVMHRFGATKEDYRGECFPMGLPDGRESILEDEDEEGFWERRARITREFLEARHENAVENERLRKRFRQSALNRGDIDGMFDWENFSQTFSIENLLVIIGSKNAK